MGNGEQPGWVRGVLGLCLLALLREGEAYGYELGRRLEQRGLGVVPGGSLYPALLRLERLGHVQAEWRPGEGGPGRKYYILAPAGSEALEREVAAWRAFTGHVDSLMRETAGR